MIYKFMQIIYGFLCTRLYENLIQTTMLIITTIALFFAIKTYISDVNQKKLKNTLEYIHLFLEGNWISEQDKKLWNKFFRHRLCRNACGDFALTGQFIVNNGLGRGDEHLDVITIFSEGKFQHLEELLLIFLI